jgi:predicted lipoprotein with Yx(FWY)xxD motif
LDKCKERCVQQCAQRVPELAIPSADFHGDGHWSLVWRKLVDAMTMPFANQTESVLEQLF